MFRRPFLGNLSFKKKGRGSEKEREGITTKGVRNVRWQKELEKKDVDNKQLSNMCYLFSPM